MIDSPPSAPTFDPNAPQQAEPALEDQARDTLTTRPRYLSDPSREPSADPLGWTLTGILSDIRSILLGTYTAKGRPEQLNISPAEGNAAYTSHTRYHVMGIKGSAGTVATRIDIRVGTEIVERVYLGAGVPFAVPASFWIDRGQTVTAIDGIAGKTDFTCILIASEAD